MGYHRGGNRYEKEPGKPKCHRIGCDRPATVGTLCIRHEKEREFLGQTTAEYHGRNCLDKSGEVIKDRSKKRPKYQRPAEGRDDE